MPYKEILKELSLLLALSLFAAFTVNYFSPAGIALVGEWDRSRGVVTAKPKDDVVEHGIEINDPLTAKRIYDRGEAVFVDARSREQYEEGHIKGAISFPVMHPDVLIDEFKNRYPDSTVIVTYCSGRECIDSHELAQYLFEAGYANIRVFIDGYPGWKAAGYPIE